MTQQNKRIDSMRFCDTKKASRPVLVEFKKIVYRLPFLFLAGFLSGIGTILAIQGH